MLSTTDNSVVVSVLSLLTVALFLGACQTESAVDEQADPELPEDELEIENPWVQPASAGENTSLYLTVANGRTSADTLLDVRAPIIGEAEFRGAPSDTSAASNALDSLTVPAEMRTALEPDGQHILLTNLSQNLSEESSVILDFVFSESGRQRVRVPVRAESSSNGQ